MQQNFELQLLPQPNRQYLIKIRRIVSEINMQNREKQRHRYSVHLFQYLYSKRKNPTRYVFVVVTIYTPTRNKADQYFGRVLRGLPKLFQMNWWVTRLNQPQPLLSKLKHIYESGVTICQIYSFLQQAEKLKDHFSVNVAHILES